MKLSFASAVVATYIALSSTIADAGTARPTVTKTAAATPGTSNVVVAFTTDTAHADAGDTFKVKLPETFDAILTPAAVLATELGMTCTVGTSAGTAITLGTHYNAIYTTSTRLLTLTHAATSLCAAGAVTLTFKKATIRAAEVAVDSISVWNSEVPGETGDSATAVTGPTAAVALVAALTGTTQPGAFSTANDEFTIDYTAAAEIASGTVTVALHGYTFGTSPVCSVGGTDAATTTKGTPADGYAFVSFDLSASVKFGTTVKTLKCTKVTRAAGGTAKTGGVQLWIAAANAGFKDTVASTGAPTTTTTAPTTPPPTAATTAPTTPPTTPPTPPPTAATSAPTKAADHSDASAITASAFVVATTVFASSMFA